MKTQTGWERMEVYVTNLQKGDRFTIGDRGVVVNAVYTGLECSNVYLEDGSSYLTLPNDFGLNVTRKVDEPVDVLADVLKRYSGRYLLDPDAEEILVMLARKGYSITKDKTN